MLLLLDDIRCALPLALKEVLCRLQPTADTMPERGGDDDLARDGKSVHMNTASMMLYMLRIFITWEVEYES